jgi:hypothetical protein
MVLGLVLLYVVFVAVLLAGTALVFMLAVKVFFAGRLAALTFSAIAGVLSTPMLVGGHGVIVLPLYVAGAESVAFPWGWLSIPMVGGVTYLVMKAVWNSVNRSHIRAESEDRPV